MFNPSRTLAAAAPLTLCLLAGCFGRGKTNIEVSLGDGVVLKMVRIEPGRFQMGSPLSEQEKVQQAVVDANRADDDTRPRARNDWVTQEKQHDVEISRPFYIGVYEITQAQYQAVMRDNPSFFSASGAGNPLLNGQSTAWFPVDSVSWDDAMEFCRRLSDKDGRRFDLPTEAEWEYACRAGSTGMYAFGNALSSKEANYFGVAQATMTVGSFEPNAFGLYDMHGNVAEWCKDWYERDYYTNSPRLDPPGPITGTYRVIRGGCCYNPTVFCRSAARDFNYPGKRDDQDKDKRGNRDKDIYGFRVVTRE